MAARRDPRARSCAARRARAGARRAPIRRRAARCSPARRCRMRRRSASIRRRSASASFGEVYVALTGVLEQLRIDRSVDLERRAGAGRARARRPSSARRDARGRRCGTGDRATLGVRGAHAARRRSFPRVTRRCATTRSAAGSATGSRRSPASIRVTKPFYVGASIAHDNTFLRLRYARDTALASWPRSPRGIDSDCDGAPCGLENPQADRALRRRRAHRRRVDARTSRSTSASSSSVARDVWLGVAYHTPPGLRDPDRARRARWT